MSSYAEQLHEKLVLSKRTNLVSIKKDINEFISLSQKSVDRAKEFEDEKDDYQEKIDDLEEENETLSLGPEVVHIWGLLGEQIKEEFESIMGNQKCNQIRFLEALRMYNKTITDNQFKSSVL